MAGMRHKTDECHTTDHRVRQNGSRIHEIISRRPNSSSQSWSALNTIFKYSIKSLKFSLNLFELQVVLSCVAYE